MNYAKFLCVVLVLAVALSACSTAATPTNPPLSTLPPVSTETEAMGTASPETTGSPSASTTETPAVSTTGTSAVPVTGADCTTVTVQTASAAGGSSSSGTSTASTATSLPATTSTGTPSSTTSATSTVSADDFLVDCNGMTLYVNTEDTANSGASVCTADCATQWPALTVADGETPMAGEGVDDSLLSTITRDDGTLQVTYNGWPLYLYSGDSLPGDQNGVGVESNWVLISPSGDPIQ